MTLDQKLQKKQYNEIWLEYCSFLNLNIEEYMEIQKRLMLEQIELYSKCLLGKKIMDNKTPKTIEEYRQTVPLTTYDDYSEILLQRNSHALPANPILWIETTWEGGKSPVKVAPYTEGMINGHKGNFLATMILATSTSRGKFSLRGGENFLYGMAPLPYLTGIVPHVLQDELTVNFMPNQKEAGKLSFGERNKLGFKMGLNKGIDLFFGLSSVITRMSESFMERNSGSGLNITKNSLKMSLNLLKAYIKSKSEKKSIMPKDIWKPKGIICAGTDSSSYKTKIEQYWGIKPTEIFGGTECTCIGTETWSKNGMVLFPDVCFYEFIPYNEMDKNIQNPKYTPKTFLMDELVAGEIYEIVISNLKGGAFARYRIGDLFKCISLSDDQEDLRIPKFTYVDRVPSIIDIAGFTRITEDTIKEAIALSKLDIHNWLAIKEFGSDKKPYMNLLVEISNQDIPSAVTKDIIKEHLSIYFKYVDSDYKDLKKMLGIDPLVITILPKGTIETYQSRNDYKIRRINPSHYDVTEILRLAGLTRGGVR